jgi:predicted aspartyl protease
VASTLSGCAEEVGQARTSVEEAGGPAAERPADAAERSTRLRVEDGRLVVQVAIDGVTGRRFIIDTAAESSAITRSLAERLEPDASRIERVRVVGVGGARLMATVALRSLALADTALTGVRAVVIDDALLGNGRYDGLLGNDVLRRFDVEIDVRGELLRLWSGSAPAETASGMGPSAGAAGADDSLVALPMTSPRAGFVAFDAALAGARVRAILDTGAPVSLLNWKAAGLAGVTRSTPGVRERTGGTARLDGAATVTHQYAFEGLAFGSTAFPRTVLRIADLPLFEVAGLAAEPAMIVGVDVLRACRVLLAYSMRTLHVCGRPRD